MPITINPYADEIFFPPGTPASVMNMVMQIRARNDALKAQQDAQPEWWESGVNNIIGGVTNQLLFPWLKNEFVNEPFESFKTDEAIRQASGIGEDTLDRAQRLKAWQDEQAFLAQQQEFERQGQALDAWQSAAAPVATPGLMDATVPNMYDMGYEGSNAETPPVIQEAQSLIAEPPVMESTQRPIESRTLPTGDMGVREPSVTTLPGSTYQPNSMEVMRALAGKDPTLAAVFADLIKGNTAIGSMVNPDKQAELAAKLEATQARIAQADAGLALRQQAESRMGANTESLIRQRLLQEGLTEARIDQILGKTAEQTMRNQSLEGMSSDERAKAFFSKGGAGSSPLTKAWSQELEIIKRDPILSQLPEQAQLEMAKRRSITTAGSYGQSSAAGRTAGNLETNYNLALHKPQAAEETRHNALQNVASKLMEIKDLMPPPARLEQLVGGMNPWWTTAAATGRVGELPLPQSMMKTLTPKEYQWVMATKDLADIVTHARTGAQMSDAERKNVESFMPNIGLRAPAYVAAWKNAYSNIEMGLNQMHDKYRGYGQWESDVRKHAARTILMKNGKSASDATVYQFLRKYPNFNPEDAFSME